MNEEPIKKTYKVGEFSGGVPPIKKTVSVKKFWLVIMYAIGIMIGFWLRGVLK